MELFCLVLGWWIQDSASVKPIELHIADCTLMYTNFEHIKEVGGSQDGMQTVTTDCDHITNV